jgi:hypothetical protein
MRIAETIKRPSSRFTMSIDFQQEQAIPLAEVANLLPKRNGKKVHYSTIYRWATKGTRGRVLESKLVGGIRYTTVEAVQRFLAADPVSRSHLTIDTAINDILARDGV